MGKARPVERSEPFAQVTQDLETLKMRLVEMQADDITEAETVAMAQELSAIRLQLKRLRFEQLAQADRLAGLRG
jgi:gamma-glutamyl phosphate reductase